MQNKSHEIFFRNRPLIFDHHLRTEQNQAWPLAAPTNSTPCNDVIANKFDRLKLFVLSFSLWFRMHKTNLRLATTNSNNCCLWKSKWQKKLILSTKLLNKQTMLRISIRTNLKSSEMKHLCRIKCEPRIRIVMKIKEVAERSRLTNGWQIRIIKWRSSWYCVRFYRTNVNGFCAWLVSFQQTHKTS